MADDYYELTGKKDRKEVRFRLRTLLLLPLFFSPFFMSLVLVSDQWARHPSRMGLGLEIVFYAAFYSLVILVCWQPKLRRQAPEINSPVI